MNRGRPPSAILLSALLLTLCNAGRAAGPLTGEDHWLSRAPTRLQVLREIETFLHSDL